MTAPLVSFVVPVRNDAERLARCLASILASHYDIGRIEMIVVDNGSTDDSEATARSLGAKTTVVPDVRVGELRNRGVAISRGELIAFVDADHELDGDWLPYAIETIEATGAAAVGASYHAPPDGTWVQRMYGALRGIIPGRKEVEWLGSGSMLVRRSAFDQVGGFDGALEACEDVDLCQRLRVAGLKVVSDDRLTSVHFGDPETLFALFKGELWRGQNNVAATLRPPRSSRALASLLVPILHLAMLLVALLGVAAAPEGLATTWVALAVIVVLAAARMFKMIVRPGGAAAVEAPAAFAVALVYHTARALALVVPGSHGLRRRG